MDYNRIAEGLCPNPQHNEPLAVWEDVGIQGVGYCGFCDLGWSIQNGRPMRHEFPLIDIDGEPEDEIVTHRVVAVS